jgi:hypothetical protein
MKTKIKKPTVEPMVKLHVDLSTGKWGYFIANKDLPRIVETFAIIIYSGVAHATLMHRVVFAQVKLKVKLK